MDDAGGHGVGCYPHHGGVEQDAGKGGQEGELRAWAGAGCAGGSLMEEHGRTGANTSGHLLLFAAYRAALDQGKAAVDQGKAAVDQGKAAVDQGKAAVDQGKAAVDQGKAAVDQGKAAVGLLSISVCPRHFAEDG